ncbi:calcium transporter ChaC [Pseudomonas sp. RIT-PI-q]|uniref:gamma-glutamylcyclotransferase n=1 Tax=Pseudomonas sp. RIT-PI-q TaxID=1690247 RepID=UPI0006CC4763|nr:gamma-glutamylcyclotransferase [Pseudomonas sp. RIT-PI-q]KPG95478.1 calcium transporter ChaC [Pseudomonas sp. RIT-PI-q]
MLTRQSLSSGAYLACFDTLPKEVLWTRERIEQSFLATMNTRPASQGIWVFGYGSLLWNPVLEFIDQQAATLHGWHRSFCLRMIFGRGSEHAPGRMLALEPGGVTQGQAFQLHPDRADEELLLLWIREMPTGAYRPLWADVTLDDGREVSAIVFVAEPDHVHYEADSTVAVIAPLVASASGQFGSNAEYVFNLATALEQRGDRDACVDALTCELQRLSDR